MRFFVGRLVGLIVVMFGITLVTFVTLHVFPADPVALVAGPGSSADQLEAIRHELGLDQPLPLQYLHYLQGLATLNLGRSIQTGQPVADDLGLRLPATLELATLSMLAYIVVSIPLGVVAAATRGAWPDVLIRILSVAGLAVPAFWFGFLLQLFLYRDLGIFPQPVGRLAPDITPPHFVTGFYLADSLLAGHLPAFRSALIQLVMPVTVLVVSRIGVGVKLTRASVLDVIGSDYVRTARAKGLGESVVLYRHVLRNALLPVITAMGAQFGYLLGGTLVVEIVFAWPGIGQYAIGSISSLDFPAIMGVTVVVAILFVLTNLVVDVLSFYVNPLLRRS